MAALTIEPSERQQAAALAVATLKQLGHEELVAALWIEWNASFTSRMGDALYVPANAPCRRQTARYRIGGLVARVRFSAALWPRASQDDRNQTVVHEICHIVTNHEAALAGRTVSSSHGYEWKSVMLRAGYSPKRCHKVDNSDLRRPSRKTVLATCKCGEHQITPLVAGRILCGAKYSCAQCRGWLLLKDFPADKVEEYKRLALEKSLQPRRRRRRCY